MKKHSAPVHALTAVQMQINVTLSVGPESIWPSIFDRAICEFGGSTLRTAPGVTKKMMTALQQQLAAIDEARVDRDDDDEIFRHWLPLLTQAQFEDLVRPLSIAERIKTADDMAEIGEILDSCDRDPFGGLDMGSALMEINYEPRLGNAREVAKLDRHLRDWLLREDVSEALNKFVAALKANKQTEMEKAVASLSAESAAMLPQLDALKVAYEVSNGRLVILKQVR
jgi:hypothetical protein